MRLDRRRTSTCAAASGSGPGPRARRAQSFSVAARKHPLIADERSLRQDQENDQICDQPANGNQPHDGSPEHPLTELPPRSGDEFTFVLAQEDLLALKDERVVEQVLQQVLGRRVWVLRERHPRCRSGANLRFRRDRADVDACAALVHGSGRG
jgi:hypothetical protein